MKYTIVLFSYPERCKIKLFSDLSAVYWIRVCGSLMSYAVRILHWFFKIIHEAITLKQNLVIYSVQKVQQYYVYLLKPLLLESSKLLHTFYLKSAFELVMVVDSLLTKGKWNKTFHHVENINKYLHLQIACTWNNDCLIVSSLLITT